MSAIIQLSLKERSHLEGLLGARTDSRQYERALALLLLEEGESVEELADRLRVSRQTIYNWIGRFEQRRELPVAERLLDGARSGRPPTAKGVIEPLLDQVLDEDPRQFGYNSTVWTADLLRRFLGQKHGRFVGTRSVSAALARLGARWKHPRHTLARRQPFWRQAKGGSNAASGGASARWC